MTGLIRQASATPSLLPDPEDIANVIDDNGRVNVSELTDFVRRLNGSVSIELNRRTIDQSARDNVLLISPSGNVFEVIVDDSGNISSNALYTPNIVTSPPGASTWDIAMTTWMVGLPTSPPISGGWWSNDGEPTFESYTGSPPAMPSWDYYMTAWLLSLPTMPQTITGWWNNSGIPTRS
jgi:hypothetical protein